MEIKGYKAFHKGLINHYGMQYVEGDTEVFEREAQKLFEKCMER